VGVAAEPDIHNTLKERTLERTAVERRDPLLGEVFDRRFRVEARIAAGGFGAIYRATHLKSGHHFALKVLHANLTNDSGVVARFRREGAALTLLRDPHTITAYELGEADDGTLYIVMELLRGESLYERYRAKGRLPWQRVVAIARAVCSSLAEAHALGIIHRDLKPTNIHLEPRGNERDFVKVLDFGIAKILQDSDIDSSDLTQAGQMIGTLDYMSPEQMVGGMCTPASDIYTLGVVMYEMIAGRKPFHDANSAAAALASVLTMTPPRLATQAVVTPDVDRVVMRCLERQHTDRFQSAIELATALDEILPGDEVVTRVAAETQKVVPMMQTQAMVDPDAVTLDPALTTAESDPDAVTYDPAVTGEADTVTASPSVFADMYSGSVDPMRGNKPGKVASSVMPAGSRLPAMTMPAAPKIAPAGTPAAPRPAPVVQKLEPVPHKSEPIDYDSTLVGRPVADRAPALPAPKLRTPELYTPELRGPAGHTPASHAPQVVTPQVRTSQIRLSQLGQAGHPGQTGQTGVPQVRPPLGSSKSMRDAHLEAPRPPPAIIGRPTTSFDHHLAATASAVARFDLERAERRNAFVRRLTIGISIAIAIAIVVALLVAIRL
jgi:tRNA A-37 threonylcarbamoyl transferase component Bud32